MSNKHPKKEQVHFVPKNTLHIEWKDLTLGKSGLESFKRIKSELSARAVLAKRQGRNMVTAIWYNDKREPLELLIKK